MRTVPGPSPAKGGGSRDWNGNENDNERAPGGNENGNRTGNENIALYLPEYDSLLLEGQLFASRLTSLGKAVRCVVVKEKRHGFDKSPWPFGVDGVAMSVYGDACAVLRGVFG